MSKAIVQRGHEPDICRDCKNFDWNDGAFGEPPEVAYCLNSLIFPNNNACKRFEQKQKGDGHA